MSKQTIITILGTLLGVIVLFIIIGLVSKDTPVEKKDSFKNSIMEGCLGSGTVSYDYCDCSSDYLLDNYSRSEVLQMGVAFETTDIIPDEMTDAAIYCIDKI